MDKEQIAALEETVRDTKAIAGVAGTEGGEQLIKALAGDVIDTTRILAGRYKTLTHTEMIAHCASLSEKLALLRVLYGASGDYERAKADLHEALEATSKQ